jgi:hypothetical protein
MSLQGVAVCAPCADGTFSDSTTFGADDDEAAKVCSPCAAGTHSSADKSKCKPCTGKTAADPKLTGICTKCADGKTPAADKLTCVKP